jgi:hypothetical protein
VPTESPAGFGIRRACLAELDVDEAALAWSRQQLAK